MQEGRKLFVTGIPKFEDESDAILQVCRAFLLEGFDLMHVRQTQNVISVFADNIKVQPVSGLARKPSSVSADSDHTDDYHHFFVDLMHEDNVQLAIEKLDGAVRVDHELLVSRAGLVEELSTSLHRFLSSVRNFPGRKRFQHFFLNINLFKFDLKLRY